MRALAIAALAACGGDPAVVDGGPLGAYRLFADALAQAPAPGVVPFSVNGVLYADETLKLRFVRVPDGEPARYLADGPFSFPDGTILVKTFAYLADYREPARGRRLLETRLLVRRAGAWEPEIYVWDEAQTTTERHDAGRSLPATWIDAGGAARSLDYRVPNRAQCGTCHAGTGELLPLGPTARQLHRAHDYGAGPEDQLDHLVAVGALADAPPGRERPRMPDPFSDAPLDARARSYLDANCAHCHRPGGVAGSTGLDLRFEAPFGLATGVCKRPASAGRASGGLTYDLVPGDARASILVYRMDSTEPGVKMPELPTQTVDRAGLDLIIEWIDSLAPVDCGS